MNLTFRQHGSEHVSREPGRLVLHEIEEDGAAVTLHPEALQALLVLGDLLTHNPLLHLHREVVISQNLKLSK